MLSFLACIAVFCRFLFQAKLACFSERPQNVNDFVFGDKAFSSPEPLVFRLKMSLTCFSDHVTKRNGGTGDENGDKVE